MYKRTVVICNENPIVIQWLGLHLNFVVQWLGKSILNCPPAIDCQSVRWYILFSDAEMRKYGTQNFVGADFAYDFA